MKHNTRKWKSKTEINSKINVFKSEESFLDNVKKSCKKPLDVFSAMFFLITCITKQTKLYAAQQGKEILNAREEEIATVMAILLLSGYCRVPQRKLYRAASPDIHNEAVARAISTNRFREIFSNLHIPDNASLNNDKYNKVRHLFEILNQNVKQLFSTTTHHSIDESMIPYYGKHGTKQFIRGKPIRFGLKLWCITSTDGYLLYAEPYCGSETILEETGLDKEEMSH